MMREMKEIHQASATDQTVVQDAYKLVQLQAVDDIVTRTTSANSTANTSHETLTN